ncbi:TMEM175 family protein [Flavobacterium phycosphaerae]|uniref:TMEM175 family protein n=1 Tax=Flavobacterium phycosphaerae TaxID=2697515 RepID=UPI00138AB0D1|nr:TMEM175 family protein [Flavobacterium phycosphaerae]
MKPNDNEEITRDEIKKEFQLERMILFSDAVFAIVITLMAIEIKIPETEELTTETLAKALLHLIPTLLAYIVSFIFIGAIWYQHLKMFSLLKDYDKGLVIRNMLLLFFIGLFPFSATLITRAKGQMIPFFMYLFMILFCVIAQFVLYHYIVIKRPSIRLNTDISEHKAELQKRKIAVIGFSASAVLIMITYLLIPQPELKNLSMLWMMVFPIVFKVMTKKK